MKPLFTLIFTFILNIVNINAQIMKDTVAMGDTVIIHINKPVDKVIWQESFDNKLWTDIPNANNDSLLIIAKRPEYLRANYTYNNCGTFQTNVYRIDVITDTLEINPSTNFLYNIVLDGDTILADSENGMDFRVSIDGYKVLSVGIKIDNENFRFRDTSIMNTSSISYSYTPTKIQFLIYAINRENENAYYFRSKVLYVKKIDNLSSKYVKNSVVDGRLQLIWPELDKSHTQYYIIERVMKTELNYNQTFINSFKTIDPTYIDSFYVGENVIYKISFLNKEGVVQKIWNYNKSIEEPLYIVEQHSDSGYTINFSKSKYFNNFGMYKLTTGLNAAPELLDSALNINDTLFYLNNAVFGDEGNFWLRILPKNYLSGITAKNWELYGHYFYVRYGISSIKYDKIATINEKAFAFSYDGDVYKYDIEKSIIVDSIKGYHTYFIEISPAGKYLMALDENISNSPNYVWSTDSFKSEPDYTFTIHRFPEMSDNLLAITGLICPTTDCNLAIYDIKTGNNLYTTSYQYNSNTPKISSNGSYLFIDNLNLVKYSANNLTVIWSNKSSDNFRFYDFDPIDSSLCYLWKIDNINNQKQFLINKTSDFSNIKSFNLDLDEIINIDYYSKKIFGYKSQKLKIYDIESGILENEIPANICNLICWGYKPMLLNNIIYSNQGVLYDLNKK